MAISTITEKGQTTVPKKIREFLHLGPGDKIDFAIGSDGKVTVMPITIHVQQLKGIIKSPLPRALTLEEMKEAINSGYSRARR